MVPGGWICRACWKANWPDDDRCLRCKAPRDPQVALFTDRPAAGSAQGRLDTELPLLVLLVLLVSLPMWISGWLAYLGAALLVVVAALGVLSGNLASGVVLIIAASVAVIIGSVWMFVSRKVRRMARWAYAVAAIAYVLPTAPSLLGLVKVPEAVAVPDWLLIAQTAIGVIYLVLGICAVFLLITSFMRTDADTSGANPPAEVDSGGGSLWVRRGE